MTSINNFPIKENEFDSSWETFREFSLDGLSTHSLDEIGDLRARFSSLMAYYQIVYGQALIEYKKAELNVRHTYASLINSIEDKMAHNAKQDYVKGHPEYVETELNELKLEEKTIVIGQYIKAAQDVCYVLSDEIKRRKL